MAKGIAAAALVAAVFVGAGMMAPAFAKHGEGGGGRGGEANFSRGSGFRTAEGRGWSGGSHPSGWSHGNKTGWGGRGMPPGLYKKYHSNSDRYSGYPSRDGYSNRYDYSNRYSGYSNYRSPYRSHYGY